MLNNHKIIEKYDKRLRQAEAQYQSRRGEAGLVLMTGMLVIIGICVVLF